MDAWLEEKSAFTVFDHLPYDELLGPAEKALAPRKAKQKPPARRRQDDEDALKELQPYTTYKSSGVEAFVRQVCCRNQRKSLVRL